MKKSLMVVAFVCCCTNMITLCMNNSTRREQMAKEGARVQRDDRAARDALYSAQLERKRVPSVVMRSVSGNLQKNIIDHNRTLGNRLE